MSRLLTLFDTLLILGLFYSGHAYADTRYVSASSLNVREQPSPNAKFLLKLTINQPITLISKQGDWCEVAVSQTIKGFVQCQLISNNPTTLAQIELEAANAVLAINRIGLPTKGVDGSNLTINKYDELEPINALFKHREPSWLSG